MMNKYRVIIKELDIEKEMQALSPNDAACDSINEIPGNALFQKTEEISGEITIQVYHENNLFEYPLRFEKTVEFFIDTQIGHTINGINCQKYYGW